MCIENHIFTAAAAVAAGAVAVAAATAAAAVAVTAMPGVCAVFDPSTIIRLSESKREDEWV